MIERLSDPLSGELLHLVVKVDKELAEFERIELISPENFLQGAVIAAETGRTFEPHFHLRRSRSFSNLIAQEAWIVLTGRVEVTYFDLQNKAICKRTIGPGDCSITLAGGHGYEILEGPSRVFEFKSGPYEGQAKDKEFIRNVVT